MIHSILYKSFSSLGNTPLHESCLRGSLETVRKLVHLGADTKAYSRQGHSFKSKCCQFCLRNECLEKCAYATGIIISNIKQ